MGGAEEFFRLVTDRCDVAVQVDAEHKLLVLKGTVTKTFVLPILFTDTTVDNEVSVDTTSSGNEKTETPELDFSVKEKSLDATVWQQTVQALRKVAGSAQVVDNPRLGTVTVTGKPSEVRRVSEYVKQLSGYVSSQVVLEVTVYEVELDAEHRHGISWQELFKAYPHGHPYDLLITGGRRVEGAFVTGVVRSRRSGNFGVLELLSRYGKVHVVSQPRLVLQNNYVGWFSVGSEIPYVKTVRREYTGDISTETIIPEMSSTHDGILFSVAVRILPDDRVLLSIAPVVSSVTGWRQFTFRDVSFSSPEVMKKELYTRLVVPDGATALLGGMQVFSLEKSTEGTGLTPVDALAGLKGSRARKYELVIAITPKVIRGAGDEGTVLFVD